MKNDELDILNLIDQVRLTAAKRKLLFSLLCFLLLAGLLTLSLGYILPHFGLREQNYLSVLLLLLLIPLLGLAYSIYNFFSTKMSRQEIALKVESAKPELMDTYACAVEIASKGGPQGPIEEALNRQVKNRFTSGEITHLITPKWLSFKIIFSLLVVNLLVCWFAIGTPLFQTAFFYIKAQNNPLLAGIEVLPGDVTISFGKDIRVEAKVKRGRAEAVVEYTQNGQWQKLPMNSEGEGHFSLVFYAIEKDFQYRVVTPDISSKEFSVSVYLEPKIDSFKMVVTPPEYTKREVISTNEFKDLVIPENSIVEFSLNTNKSTKISIQQDKTDLPISKDFAKNHLYSFRAETSNTYTFNLKDNEGYSSSSKSFKISVVKDMPPLVEVTKPAKDVSKFKDEVVDLEINALDDFGLQEVKLHIEFLTDVEDKFILDSRVYSIFKAKDEKVLEKNLFHNIDLKEEAVKEGDIISYYLTASDNKQPIPQTTQSKIYFIQIKPSKSDTQTPEQEGDGQPEQSASVADLIALQKDVIRAIIDIKNSAKTDPTGEKITDPKVKQKIAADVANLKIEVQKRLDKLKEEAEKQNASLGVLETYFQASVNSLKDAEFAINGDKLNEGYKLNNQSLHNLIKIATEFEKNSQKSKLKNPPPPDPQQQAQEEEKEEERLAKMLDKLEELEEKQKDLNKELRQKNQEELAQKELQKQLQEQKEKMEKLAEELQGMKQENASQQMQQASQQQQQAAQQQQQGNSQGAQEAGQQAQQSLENAKQEIQRTMRDQARQKLQEVARQLEKNIEKQQQINEKTSAIKDSKSEEGKKQFSDLKKQQEEVEKEIGQVMDQLAAGANELDEQFPEVAEALRNSREFAANQGLQGKIKRSINALHYNRQEAAEREQEKAFETMNLLGHKVRDAIGQLPQATLDELLKMRQQIETARRETAVAMGQGMSQEQANKASKEISQMMQDIGERLKNNELQHTLPEALQDAAKESGSNVGSFVGNQFKALNQAAFILDSLISQADLEKRLSLNKNTGAPPDEYRRSVREYLKSLSTQEK